MNTTKFRQPSDAKKAREAGMSPTAWSLRKTGKRRLSLEAEERYQRVTAKYARADEAAELAQRQLRNFAEVGRRVLEVAR